MASYKSIVKSLCERDSKRWLYKVLDSNSISYLYADVITNETEIDPSEKLSGYTFRVYIRVRLDNSSLIRNYVTVHVSGYVDNTGIYVCSLWGEHNDLLWVDSVSLRETLKICTLTL